MKKYDIKTFNSNPFVLINIKTNVYDNYNKDEKANYYNPLTSYITNFSIGYPLSITDEKITIKIVNVEEDEQNLLDKILKIDKFNFLKNKKFDYVAWDFNNIICSYVAKKLFLNDINIPNTWYESGKKPWEKKNISLIEQFSFDSYYKDYSLYNDLIKMFPNLGYNFDIDLPKDGEQSDIGYFIYENSRESSVLGIKYMAMLFLYQYRNILNFDVEYK